MIANGICLMGGCFSQNEAGQSVDSYWPAEKVKIDTGVQNIIIADCSVAGGDHTHDELSIIYQVDDFGDSFAVGGLRPVSGRKGFALFQGYSGFCVVALESGNTSAWEEALGERVIWWARDALYKRGADAGPLEEFSLADSDLRGFRIGSALASQNRFIFNLSYSNRRTGVKAQWQPMIGLYGIAFYEPSTATLSEQ